MNIDDLRWILAGCGVILIAGIYIRDRFRRRLTADSKPAVPSDSVGPEGAFSLKAGVQDLDSNLDLPSMRADDFDPLFTDRPNPYAEPEIGAADVPDPEPFETDEPVRIVQIKVVAFEGKLFSGALLIDALRAVGLEYGSMNIFHRQRNSGEPPVFSVVNMLEPGTFPVDNPSDFKSPGVVFFLQVGLVENPVAAFDEMVRIAQILASRISGEVLDAENQPLTAEITGFVRESLVRVAG
jgi:cell division protein ZipA